MGSFDIAVIGAGKTGRGFIGRLLQESGQTFLLVDKNKDLVEDLKASDGFEVEFFGGVRETFKVKNYAVEHTGSLSLHELFSHVKVVFVSVGGNNIVDAGHWLAETFERRIEDGSEECSFITCENANKPAYKLKEAFLSGISEDNRDKAGKLYGFSEATVFCTTIENKESPLNILSENYPYLQCDAEPLKENIPNVKGLQPVKGFDNFLIRKLYTYNGASAAISYLGWLKGYEMYSDAANDEDILSLLDKLYKEVGAALCKAHGYDEEDQKEFAMLSLKKFCDKTIADTILRNAREPHRKLGFNERIIGPALLVQEYGGDTTTFEITAAAALLYNEPSDIEWNKLKEQLGPEGILQQICKLEPCSALSKGIMEYYVILKEHGFKYKGIARDNIMS